METPVPARQTLSGGQARRIVLAAQDLVGPRPPTPARPLHIRRLVDRLGAVQIDSVNVLVRAHYLPAFSRLGAYSREHLEAEAWGRRPSLFEYWGHEASLLPVARQPLFRWRMRRAREGETWAGLARFGRERRPYIEEVLRRIERGGPVTGGDFAEGRREAGWWNWSDGKRALEWLFWAGHITTRTRRGFERVYDLIERVLPPEVVGAPTPTEADAHRELLRIAARALGVATETDLRDYFRMPGAETRARLAELVEAGELHPVAVDGWGKTAFLSPGARMPRRASACALLSPFDNLIFFRERAERLFGVRIRLEIYTPEHKREHGYYVLPFLQGEALTARVDLKSDRQAGVLRVLAAHLEPGATVADTAPMLAAELARLAAWLALSGVSVSERGGLAEQLADCITHL